MDLPSIRWAICPGIPPSARALAPQLPPMLAQLLYNRGIVGAAPEILEHFLSPRWEDGLHDPFLLADMDRAVARILEAVERRETIGVFGHYDADGITALVLLSETLSYLNALVIPYLPNRCDDYGVNENGIAELSRQGVRLLISVDSGIRSFNAPQAAARAGMDLIITDHHTVLRTADADVLPPALAVINPLRADCQYPCKCLAGVGVAFKLAQALLRAHAQRSGQAETHFAKWLLDLVCLGTIADVVDVTGENRTLVSLGLEILRRARRPGVRALLSVARTDLNRLDAEAIGFQLAPRINAAARLESADTSMELLRATEAETACRLAQRLDQFNRERQRLTQQAMDDIAKRYGDTLAERKAIVVTGAWPEGIIGLIAGKLAEAYNRPALAIETNSQDELHGSARSRVGFHIAQALEACDDLLSRHGGHAQAAGFALPACNLEAFRERVLALADERLTEADLESVLTIDALVQPEQINSDLLQQAQALEPCGPGNPSAVFALPLARVVAAESFGPGGAHLRLRVEGAERPLKAIGWRMGPRAAELQPGTQVALAFSLKADPYCGVALDLLDIVAH